ncbi:MAG: 6-carboxytetrahydropterin synthase [Deltaproteobacteria bacterium]|nr:6-carboxytetrahydropterin synthase [Deltaproteobacteria bacterium]MBN2846674.1 6-carboxytetrahydropterin synthase [Deltaproteobacteria bacterium]
MYEITVKRTFSAAHTLMIGGKSETLHGHNFTVEVTLSSERLDNEGLVVDFRVLKGWTDETLEKLDHSFLNELSFFQDINPTSENIARFVYEKISEKIQSQSCKLKNVAVWESESAKAVYRGSSNG